MTTVTNLFPELTAERMTKTELAAMDSWQLARRQSTLVERVRYNEGDVEAAKAELSIIARRHETDESVQDVD
jgi:hypothetical protein